MKLQIIDTSDSLWADTLQSLRHDFYHLPAYVALEAQRMQAIAKAVLIQQGEKQLFLPYLLRRCDDIFQDDLQASEIFDLVSPYGYPGFLFNAAATESPEFIQLAIDHLMQTLKAEGVCSVVLRSHPILNQQFNSTDHSQFCSIQTETVAVDLSLTEVEIWQQTRSEHRNKINKCKRAGLVASVVPWRDHLDTFIDIYTETMNRVGASSAYYFTGDYFLQFAEVLQEKLHLCIVELDRQVVCAGLFTECCGIVQYHLGGTRQAFLKQSPSTLMFDYVRYWAKDRGNQVFHLGGGVGGANDSLHHFKAGFSHQRYSFSLLCATLDEEKYQYLVSLQAKRLAVQAEQLLQTKFFPVYRSSVVHS
ncbi:GNAT family N-acetyltransferase [Egbenema bharatensis]|uniref:GNAT family N-acetyltransferase n=1 Tax=Egbenema bharatensis TaxID=3463334 RepID=UPI003A8BEDA7